MKSTAVNLNSNLDNLSSLINRVYRFDFTDMKIFSQSYSDEALEAMEEFPGLASCSCGGCKSKCVTTTKCSSCN